MFALVNVNGVNREVYLGNLSWKSRSLEYAALIGYTRFGWMHPFMAGLISRVVYITLGVFESLKIKECHSLVDKNIKKNLTHDKINIGRKALEMLIVPMQLVIGCIRPVAMLQIQIYFGLIADFFEGLNKNIPLFKGEMDGTTAKGRKTWPDSHIEDGKFKDNILIDGMKIYPNGNKDEGKFEDGIFVEGTRTYPNGTKDKGNFEHDILIDGTRTYLDGTEERRKFEIADSEKPFETTLLKKHRMKLNADITNLATLKEEWQKEILTILNKLYAQIEASDHPAAGYILEFDTRNRDKRTVNIVLSAVGEREPGSSMEMPLSGKVTGPNDCDFCKKKDVMPGYEEEAAKGILVMESMEGTNLTKSIEHYGHFFSMPLQTQCDALRTALKIVEKIAENAKRFTLVTNIGTLGSQTFPHFHMHNYVSL